MVEYEYKLAATILIFYGILFLLLGMYGLQTAVEMDYEHINVFTGVFALLRNPFSSSTVPAILFSIMILLPMFFIISLVLGNTVLMR